MEFNPNKVGQQISIHTPARGVTFNRLGRRKKDLLFQSTLPQGE